MKIPPPPPDFPQPGNDRFYFGSDEDINSPEFLPKREYSLSRTRELLDGYDAKRMERERALASKRCRHCQSAGYGHLLLSDPVSRKGEHFPNMRGEI